MIDPNDLSQKRKASTGFGIEKPSFMPVPNMSVSPHRHGSVPPNLVHNEGESMAYVTLREEIMCSSSLAKNLVDTYDSFKNSKTCKLTINN